MAGPFEVSIQSEAEIKKDEPLACPVERIETPFDIEAILQACPKLYEQWKINPFYLDIDRKGNICIRAIKI